MLSFRELEYLEFIRKRDIGLYGEVLDHLRVQKLGENPTPSGDPNRDDAPLYPSLPKKDRYDDEEKRPDYGF